MATLVKVGSIVVILFLVVLGLCKLSELGNEVIAEASVTKINGSTKLYEHPYWTAFEVLVQPDRDCFTDGPKTIKVELSVVEGYHWEARTLKGADVEDRVEYCVKRGD